MTPPVFYRDHLDLISTQGRPKLIVSVGHLENGYRWQLSDVGRPDLELDIPRDIHHDHHPGDPRPVVVVDLPGIGTHDSKTRSPGDLENRGTLGPIRRHQVHMNGSGALGPGRTKVITPQDGQGEG